MERAYYDTVSRGKILSNNNPTMKPGGSPSFGRQGIIDVEHGN
jgi:hypothetical protein